MFICSIFIYFAHYRIQPESKKGSPHQPWVAWNLARPKKYIPEWGRYLDSWENVGRCSKGTQYEDEPTAPGPEPVTHMDQARYVLPSLVLLAMRDPARESGWAPRPPSLVAPISATLPSSRPGRPTAKASVAARLASSLVSVPTKLLSTRAPSVVKVMIPPARTITLAPLVASVYLPPAKTITIAPQLLFQGGYLVSAGE